MGSSGGCRLASEGETLRAICELLLEVVRCGLGPGSSGLLCAEPLQARLLLLGLLQVQTASVVNGE